MLDFIMGFFIAGFAVIGVIALFVLVVKLMDNERL